MTKDVTLSVRIERKLSEKIGRRARQTNRSKSSLTTIALENYFAIEAMEIARVKRTLAEAKAGGPFVADDEVMQWLESWGTENELPRPKATIRY